jgi:hypothetical protein
VRGLLAVRPGVRACTQDIHVTNPHMRETTTSALDDLIEPFLRQVADGRIDIYNEFSLQHELGFHLRQSLPNDNVQFERNVRDFFPQVSQFKKREIDIAVFSPGKDALKWAIELKFPRNGQYPEQMFSFCKDVMFVEQLKLAGFAHAGLLIFADDPLFWHGSQQGIYQFFRGAIPMHGLIRKPTGGKDDEVNISGSYPVEWKTVAGGLKYATIEAT